MGPKIKEKTGNRGFRPRLLVGAALVISLFTVAVVANYRPRKGIEYVIDAARYLPDGVPVHFLLVGGDLDRPELARRIAASPMADHFHVLGFRRDAPAITAACDTSILASVKREGLPKTVIESMVYAVPPVVTDTGGLLTGYDFVSGTSPHDVTLHDNLTQDTFASFGYRWP